MALLLLWYIVMVTKELVKSGEVQSIAMPQPVEKRNLILPGILGLHLTIHYNG